MVVVLGAVVGMINHPHEVVVQVPLPIVVGGLVIMVFMLKLPLQQIMPSLLLILLLQRVVD